MMNDEHVHTGVTRGLLAISPIVLLVALFVAIGVVAEDFYKVPMLVVFILVAAYTLSITFGKHEQHLNLLERIGIFSKGAGGRNLLQMIWIFVLAGAFASSARAMGSIEAMVELTLSVVPAQAILVGLFLASVLVSFGIGTSVGTIVAITPLASDLAVTSGQDVALTVAAVVGGALFGDNLSFISDTTVASTQTQKIPMKDKFLSNLIIALPAALITAAIYIYIGLQNPSHTVEVAMNEHTFWLITPYLFVFLAALSGVNVLVVLFFANILTGVIGVSLGVYSWFDWSDAMTRGIGSMGELILISMIAGGLMALIRYNGGITFLIALMRHHIAGPRGAQLMIAMLVSVVNICTANNTIAILSTGSIARDIADRYGVSRRRSASILDIYSCCTQGILPYGAQLLMAAGIAEVSPMLIIPSLYYPLALAICATTAILLIPNKH